MRLAKGAQPLILAAMLLGEMVVASGSGARATTSTIGIPSTTDSTSSTFRSSQVPALFVFGDSTVDSGNNNYLWTMARADYLPFGRDFDTGQATGRFANGRLSIDYLASFLGLPLPPPYLSNRTSVFRYGANFASAGSGILNTTGNVFGQHISIAQQILYFKEVKQRLAEAVGSRAEGIISRAIYYISTGTNDYLKNYYNLDSYYAGQYSQDEFKDLLLQELSQSIQTLYSLGARKFAVVSLSPMGCIPSQLARFTSVNGSPIALLNAVSQNFNNGLLGVLRGLQWRSFGLVAVYNNAYDLLQNIIDNHQNYGFKSANSACCGMGRYGGGSPCLPTLKGCHNACEYVFWDEFHPTSASYFLLAKSFWEGGPQCSVPMNLKQLAAL